MKTDTDTERQHDPALTRWLVKRNRALALYRERALLGGMTPTLIDDVFRADPVAIACMNQSAIDERIEFARATYPVAFIQPAVAPAA